MFKMAGIVIKSKRKRVEPLFHSDINLRPSFRQTRQSSSFLIPENPWGRSHIKVTGMLVGKLKLNPYGRPMWVCLKLKLTRRVYCLLFCLP